MPAPSLTGSSSSTLTSGLKHTQPRTARPEAIDAMASTAFKTKLASLPRYLNIDEQPPPGLSRIAPEQLDTRSDDEIAQGIRNRHDVTSERNIWAFWHSGFDSMRPWMQRNVINWVRRNGPEWTLHFVDNVPGSETNIFRYVDESLFPDAFRKGTMDGPWVGPHQGDLVRLPLLWTHGGVWMDTTSMLLRRLDDICWRQLADDASPFELCTFIMDNLHGEVMVHNAFIAARRRNPFIKRWHDIYSALWRGGATNAHGFTKHPLLTHLRPMYLDKKGLNFPESGRPDAAQDGPELKAVVDDYLAHNLAFQRLINVDDPNDGFNGHEYFARRVLHFAGWKETGFHLVSSTGWNGSRQYDMMAARRAGDAVVRDATWQAAEQVVQHILTSSSMLKLPHGSSKCGWWLANIWDRDEFAEADIREGTFAAYLRFASVCYEQTRAMVPLQLDMKPADVVKVGYLEPVVAAGQLQEPVVADQLQAVVGS